MQALFPIPIRPYLAKIGVLLNISGAFILCMWLFLTGNFKAEGFEKKFYNLSTEAIDVIIPCAPKDADTLEQCIRSIKQYCRNVRKIIVVSRYKLSDSADWFDEAKYPFSKKDVALEIFNQNILEAEKFLNSPDTRIGWIYQQFLKLYAPFIIPNLSSNMLMVDADVIFLNSISFFNFLGEPLFTVGNEYHKPYFEHMASLLPGLNRVHDRWSGIAHHMLFQKPILQDLFHKVESYHQMPLWKAICRSIDHQQVYLACFSEYEIYFNFTLLHTDQAHIRDIKWANCNDVLSELVFRRYKRLGYRYVACHAHYRDH